MNLFQKFLFQIKTNSFTTRSYSKSSSYSENIEEISESTNLMSSKLNEKKVQLKELFTNLSEHMLTVTDEVYEQNFQMLFEDLKMFKENSHFENQISKLTVPVNNSTRGRPKKSTLNVIRTKKKKCLIN